MPPPTDLGMALHVKTASPVQRDVKTMFVDTNGSDIQALNEALAILQQRREKFSLITTGPQDGISTQWPRETVAETDDYAIAAAMLKSGIFLSTRPGAHMDIRLRPGPRRRLLAPLSPSPGVLPRKSSPKCSTNAASTIAPPAACIHACEISGNWNSPSATPRHPSWRLEALPFRRRHQGHG